MPVFKPQALIENPVQAIRQDPADNGIKRTDLGLSGGFDSAVMADTGGPVDVPSLSTKDLATAFMMGFAAGRNTMMSSEDAWTFVSIRGLPSWVSARGDRTLAGMRR